MQNFNPRHLRTRYAKKGAAADDAKKKAFRRCKNISNQFIHQSASALESPRFANRYAQYCERTMEGKGFRKG